MEREVAVASLKHPWDNKMRLPDEKGGRTGERHLTTSGDETAGERTRTRVGRTRGGMRSLAARIGEKLRREIGSGRRPRVGDG